MKSEQITTDELPSRYEALQVVNSLKDNDTIQLADYRKNRKRAYTK